MKRLHNHRSGGPSRIWAKHIKRWLSEARKEKAAAEKSAETEGTASVLGGTGGEETEERREKTPEEMKNWDR